MFDKAPEWLRRWGFLGNLAANLLQIILSYPGVTVTAILAFLIGRWDAAIEFIQKPGVYVSFGTFLFLLWTYIGITILRDRKTIKSVQVVHDYAYSLVLDGGFTAELVRFTDGKNNGKSGIGVSAKYRNVGSGPLNIRIENITVVLNSRTNDLDFPRQDLIIPRLAPRVLRCPPVLIDDDIDEADGSVIIELSYGSPEKEFARAYKIHAGLQIKINQNNILTRDSIKSEIDKPYVAR